MKQRLLNYLLHRSGVFSRCLDYSFDNFREASGNRRAFDRVQRFGDDFTYEEKDTGVGNHRGRGLYLYGPPGGGKTHLAAALIRHVLARHPEAFIKDLEFDYFSQTEFDEEMRQQGIESPFFMISSQDYLMSQKLLFGKREQFTFIQEVCRYELLILDDLGTEPVSFWSVQELLYLVCFRYNNLKATVYTSNYDLSQLLDKYRKQTSTHISEKLISRITETCTVLKLSGGDFGNFNQDHPGIEAD